MYKSLDLPMTELLPDVLLKASDKIVTEDSGTAAPIFADGARIIVHANSSLIFDTLSQYGDTGMVDTGMVDTGMFDTRARLESGRADTKIPTFTGGGSQFQIYSPAATTAVRGTGYRISVNPGENITRTEVSEGNGAISTQKITELIPDGYGTVIETGVDAQTTITVNARPESPLALNPSPNKKLRVGNPAFKGSKPRGLTSYRFQLATDFELNKLLANQELSNNEGFTLEEELKPGDYFWRLASIDDIDNLGPYGETQTFSYSLPPNEPGLQQPEIYFIRVATIDGDGTTSPFSTIQEFNKLASDNILPSILTPLALLQRVL